MNLSHSAFLYRPAFHALTIILPLALSLSAMGDVTLPAVFSEHAVLQKSAKTAVWGKASANEKVTITLDKSIATVIADADGKWNTMLDLTKEGQGPYDMTVAGSNKITIRDVVIGEVWVCSGQSNMSVGLGDDLYWKEEIAKCENPQLRQFTPNASIADLTPQEDLPGHWILASPSNGPAFSAVAYYFGKSVQNKLKVPVGLIKTCWGGTPCEAWTSAQALDTVPELKQGKDKVVTDYQNFQDYLTKHKTWVEKYQRGDRPLPQNLDAYVKPDAPTDGWKTITLPNKFSDIGLPDSGAVWLRKKITLPPNGLNQPSGVGLGDFRDNVTLFWNGRNVGSKDVSVVGGGFYISGEFTPTKEITLAVRVTCSSDGMGILPGKSHFGEQCSGPLKGEWLAKVEYELPPLDAEAKASLPVLPPFPAYEKSNIATFLYNGMVHPFIPYRIAGVVWYQGETNANRAFQYRTAFPLMIKDWRKQWGQGNFPFYYCQLANFNNIPDAPGENDWAELREAQDMTLSLPNTGEAILIDIGEAANIHPRNKRDAGVRVALAALAKTYGQRVTYSGPTYQSIAVEGDKVRVHFKNATGGLIAKQLPATYIPTTVHMETTAPLVRKLPNSEVEGFAVCGEDKKWVWADASIKDSEVIVSAPGVSKPIAVRYAWASNPICNLYNGAGLPAGPFRSDSFPSITEKARY